MQYKPGTVQAAAFHRIIPMPKTLPCVHKALSASQAINSEKIPPDPTLPFMLEQPDSDLWNSLGHQKPEGWKGGQERRCMSVLPAFLSLHHVDTTW